LPSAKPYENVRGNLDIKIEECIMCGMCEKKCPSQCITVNKEAKTWEVDPYACVYCGICVESCPTDCLFMDKPLPQARQGEGKQPDAPGQGSGKEEKSQGITSRADRFPGPLLSEGAAFFRSCVWEAACLAMRSG
jgi:ech hydrogenase subunit F